MTDSSDSWATLELKVFPQTGSLGDESLDTLSYLLAQLDGVGGVETRDGGPELINPLSVADPAAGPSPEDPTRIDIESWFGQAPGAVVYTTPEHLESLEAHAHRLAQSLQIKLECRQQVRNDDSWRDTWKQFYKPIDIAEGRLRICPSWERDASGKAQHTLVLDPGRAFGTGLHESTRLCLQSLAQWSAPPPNTRVLDLGCGSGILGLSVATLFEEQLEQVRFCDLDPEAVSTAQENAQLNEPWSARMEFESGTARTLAAQSAYHWVLANIRPEVLIPDAQAITELVAPGGQLLLSGILDEEKDEVLARYESLGLKCIAQTQLRGWTALTLTR